MPEKDEFQPGKHQLTPNSKSVNQPLYKRFQQCHSEGMLTTLIAFFISLTLLQETFMVSGRGVHLEEYYSLKNVNFGH